MRGENVCDEALPNTLEMKHFTILLFEAIPLLTPRVRTYLLARVISPPSSSLQQSKILKVMGKKITRKALEMLRKLATSSQDFEVDPEDKDERGDVKQSPYLKFWAQFGKR